MTRLGPVQLAKRYRCLQILQLRANDTIRYPLAALQILFMSITIRAIYGMVKFEGELRFVHLNNTYGNVIFLIVLFKALGQVYENSTNLLLKEKGILGRAKWFRKFHRSCWPLKFEMAGLYFVDPGMSLTMGSFVVQNVVNMILVTS